MKRWGAILVCALVVLLGTVSKAHSETSAEKFLSAYDKAVELGDEQTRAILAKVLGANFNGLSWANTWLEMGNRAPLFCAPGKLGVTNTQVVSILKRFVDQEAKQKYRDGEYGMILLLAAINTFPCK